MSARKKILLIDDEEDFCFFLSKNLKNNREFEVLTATDGEEGINLARREKPDAILLDIVMPKIDGPDVAEVLNNDPVTKDIPIIFLTAVVTEKEFGAEPIKEIGGHNFIAKPVDTERLISSIKMILK
jgi:CheY-like chemotaxis protein